MDWVLLRRYGGLLLSAVVLAAFTSLRLESYLLFHTAVEISSVVVSLGIFVIAWNLRRTLDNPYLLFVGLASFFVGLMDLLHAMSYKGMGVFAGFGADQPTQFWIAGRYIQSLTFLIAPFFIDRKVRVHILMTVYAAATAVLAWSVFAGLFPTCFVDGVGLTPFKKGSEYVVAAMLAGGLYLLRRRKEAFDPDVLRVLTWMLSLTIVGELAFTLYITVTDWHNLAGHLVRLTSNYLLYRAMVQTGLTRPFDLLFRNLKRSEEALQKERNFITGVLDTAGALMVVLDAEGRVVRFNRTCEELTGYATADVAGKRLTDVVVPPEDRERVRERFGRLLAGKGQSSVEHRWVLKDGRECWISFSITTLGNAQGEIEYVVGIGTDITERRQVEAELKEREERLRVMVESVQTGMLLIDRETHTIVNANPASAGLIGLPPEAIAGRSCREFFRCTESNTCPFDTADAAAAAQEPVLINAKGQQIPLHRTAVPVMTDGREHLMESFIDISGRKRIEEELRSLSMVDELTGLYNRRGFLALAQKEIDAAVRLGSGLALLFVDVNGLKEINDNWGHVEGDRVLVVLARILQDAFRETTLIARIGGDEFVVLAPQFAGARPSLLVDRLLQGLEDYNTTNDRTYEIRVSTGVARLQPEKPVSVHELLNQADAMMYVEKRRRAMTGTGGSR